MDPRLAAAADLPAIREVVTAAYARYLSRMDRPPAPILADYGAAVDAGQLWVTGGPVTGLIELTKAGDSRTSRTWPCCPRPRAQVSAGSSWILPNGVPSRSA